MAGIKAGVPKCVITIRQYQEPGFIVFRLCLVAADVSGSLAQITGDLENESEDERPFLASLYAVLAKDESARYLTLLGHGDWAMDIVDGAIANLYYFAGETDDARAVGWECPSLAVRLQPGDTEGMLKQRAQSMGLFATSEGQRAARFKRKQDDSCVLA